MDNQHIMSTGTTTLGIVCKDGLVLAADKRATSGHLIADKKAKKVNVLTDNIVVTIAGTVSDAQLLIKLGRAELKLKSLRTGSEVTVKEAANLVAGMIYQNIRKMSMIPGIAHFIMGGKDAEGFHLFDLYADGSVSVCDKYISSGSGSVMAYGVLETLYTEGMSLDEGVKLAIKCVNAAISRDTASGNGVEIITITKDGIKTVLETDIETRIKE